MTANISRANPLANNYYRVLGVEKNASFPEIKATRNQLVREYHTDKDPNAILDAIQNINVAYAVLSDPEARRTYDNKLEERTYSSSSSAYPPFYNEPFPNCWPAPPKPPNKYDKTDIDNINIDNILKTNSTILHSFLYEDEE